MPWSHLATFVIGGLLGGVLAWVLAAAKRSQRHQAALVEAAERTSAAETQARAEAERRREAETERDTAETKLSELDRSLAVASERVQSSQALLAEQQEFVQRSRKELEDAFQSLAAAALKGSSEQLLALAEQRLTTARTAAHADLEERKQAIEKLLQPLGTTLQRLEQRTAEIERDRLKSYSALDTELRKLAETTTHLQEKTTSLDSALRSSETRGRWGEIALRNVAELAGMTEHVDFEEQLTLGGGGRPDMVVHLPGRRSIAVDAKAPLAAYLEAAESESDSHRTTKLQDHAKALRQHVRNLAGRDYARDLEGSVDFVVLFLPGDSFLSAALSTDPKLQVEALREQVLLASPSTLVALLRTIAVYWQQRSLAENAEAISSVAQELYERAAKFAEDLGALGRGLTSAVDAYNRAVGSFERRLLPMSQKLEQLQVTERSRRKLSSPEPVERSTRKPT